MIDGFERATELPKDLREIFVSFNEGGAEPERVTKFHHGFGQLACAGESDGEVAMQVGVGGRGLQARAKRAGGVGPALGLREGVTQSRIRGRSLRIETDEGFKLRDGLGLATGASERRTPIAADFGRGGVELRGRGETREGVARATSGGEGERVVGERFGGFGVELKRAFVAGKGLGPATDVAEDVGAVAVGGGVIGL